MEWDQLWAWNKKVLDPIAPRYWAVAEEDLWVVHFEKFETVPIAETLILMPAGSRFTSREVPSSLKPGPFPLTRRTPRSVTRRLSFHRSF